MRLCVITEFFVPHYQGGGERRYYEVLKRLAAKGHTIELVCMKIKGAEKYEYVDGVHVYHVGPTIATPPKRKPLDFMRFWLAASWWLCTHKYDVVEANTWMPMVPVSLFGKLRGAKTSCVIHDLSSGKSDQWLAGRSMADTIEKILIRLPFDRLICVSNPVKLRLSKEYGINPAKISVFYDGVDIKLIDSVKVARKEKNTICYVGRLIPHKHVDDLIEAVKIVKKSIPGIRLKVVGGGQELERLKALTSRLKLESSVTFFGVVPEYKDMIKELKGSQLLVLPSTREGFGIVLVEAFASNVPCVAYRSDGVVEVIDEEENGFLVKQRDIRELARRIKQLLTNKKLADSFAKKGRAKTEASFDWNKIASKLEKFYLSFSAAK